MWNRKPGLEARVRAWALGTRPISLIICTNESLDLPHVRTCIHMRQLGIITDSGRDKPCCYVATAIWNATEHHACTSTEESSRLRASASLRLCTRTTIFKDGETDGKATCRYVQVIYAVQPLALSLLEDSGPNADTYFDTERRACPQPAAFFSRRTRITPSTYVYTSFVSDLVLAKSVAVGKSPRQTLLFDRLATYCVGTLPSLQNRVHITY